MGRQTSKTDKDGFTNAMLDESANGNEIGSEDNWEQTDIGDFEVVELKSEGDVWIGRILADVEENRPDWLPEKFEDNSYVTQNKAGKKGIISKFWKLEEYIQKTGVMGEGVLFKITRGKKTEKAKNRSYVDFEIRHKITDPRKVIKLD